MTSPTEAEASATGDKLQRADRLAQSFEKSITNAFSSGIVQGRQFGTILQSVGQSLEQIALKAALQPLSAAIGGWMSTLAGSAAGAVGTALSSLVGIKPFADGGVIGTPTYFPTGGGLALAGEAGPEAIMPLARGPDGRLGVRGAGGAAPVTVTVQITTPDAESFRRSESLVSAQLARAVARGQRGL